MCEQGEIDLLQATNALLEARIEAYQTALDFIRRQRDMALQSWIDAEARAEQCEWLADLSADGD